MVTDDPSFVPARSPAEDLAALFTPEERRKAAHLLCQALIRPR
jgi:hypothetical protein